MLWQDLKHCFRSLAGTPVATATVVVLLGPEIGSTKAALGWIDLLFLMGLSLERPNELVLVGTINWQGKDAPIRSKALEALQTVFWLASRELLVCLG